MQLALQERNLKCGETIASSTNKMKTKLLKVKNSKFGSIAPVFF